MVNLYVFAIGGSGERVMRSLIMLLSSGMQIGAQRLVPVFIDNDTDSNALTKCLNLIKYYNDDPKSGGNSGAHSVYGNITANSNLWPSFFKTEIAEPIILNKSGNNIGTLQTIIGNLNSDDAIQRDILEERDLLFTSDDLQMPLSVGFVGNPNIGSVVLNSLSLDDAAFQSIETAVTQNDGVFVIGSLFGGTGAAGFPLIVNTFNKKPTGNRPLLGGTALLPYFNLQSQNKTTRVNLDTTRYDVDSDTFDTKARAALMYYDDYMRNLDYLYYVGDSEQDTYEHYVGGDEQENPAHLVELMSALSVIDFSRQAPPSQSQKVVYKSPVWDINTSTHDAATLPANISNVVDAELRKALIKFEMMAQIFSSPHLLKWGIDQKKAYAENIGFTDPMRLAVVDDKSDGNLAFAWGVRKLIQEWKEWMKELGRDQAIRKFRIYNENIPATDGNITQLFYSNSTFGIARTEMKGLFSKKEAPVDPQISEALQKAYKQLHPQGKPETALTIPDEQRMGLMLQIISQALDDVIKNKCI